MLYNKNNYAILSTTLLVDKNKIKLKNSSVCDQLIVKIDLLIAKIIEFIKYTYKCQTNLFTSISRLNSYKIAIKNLISNNKKATNVHNQIRSLIILKNYIKN